VITRAYDALSKHAHSCSVVKWENLSALKTLKAPSVSLPEPTHCLCTIYKHKRRKAKPHSLGSKKPRFRFSTVLTKTTVSGSGTVSVTALVNTVVKVNILFTVATSRIGLGRGLELGIGFGLDLVLPVAVSDLGSGDSKANVYRHEYPRITTSVTV